MTGLESNDDDDNNINPTSFSPSGLSLVSLLLDLLDYLLFVAWRKNTSPLNPKQELVSGHWNNTNKNSNNGATSG
jgi:hypothetical protein